MSNSKNVKDKVYQLIYISTARTPFSKQDLLELLTKSRAKNTQRNITGMLLYKNGVFQQILEGPEDAIRSLYSTIHKDPRHHGLIRVMEGFKECREFAEWSMGFTDLNSSETAQIPGYNSFLNDSLSDEKFTTNPSACVQLMQCFRKNA